jgi:uncharacterized protein YeaO (DUF488 family)
MWSQIRPLGKQTLFINKRERRIQSLITLQSRRFKEDHNMVKIKRAYDKVEKDDGIRVLVDRLWPRGLKQEEIKIDLWLKEVAASTELRKWFSHDPSRWKEFCMKYNQELKNDEEKRKALIELGELASRGNLTLIYSAKDEKHNNAVVLKKLIESLLKEN